MWKTSAKIKTAVDNPQNPGKPGKILFAFTIWICYNYEAVLAEQDIWLKSCIILLT